MSSEEEFIEEQREHEYHSANLNALANGDQDKTPETLKYISEPEESVDAPLDALQWINSKSASTANFTDDDVRSKDWVLEYHQLLSKLIRPPQYGLKGHVRAWAYDDVAEYKMPLKSERKLETEGFTEIGKEASTRSRDGWGVETSTKDTKESIVRGNEESSGGLLGRFRS